MENQANNYDEISLTDIINILKRNICLLLSTSIVGVLLALVLGVVQMQTNPPEMYQYQAAVTVNLENSAGVRNQSATMLHVFSSSSILQAAITKLKITGEDFEVTTEPTTKPNEYNIIVTGSDLENVVALANEVVAQAQTATAGAMTMAVNTITENARLIGNPLKISQDINFKLYLAAGLILGLMSGLFLTFVVSRMRNAITSAEDIERSWGIKVLAIIPENSKKVRLKYFFTVR